MQMPAYRDVLAARPRVYAHLRPSPLHAYPALDEWTGCRTWVKHENQNPTGAFKIRGGLNLVAQLSDREREAGIVAASTGNHGQSLAYAARLHAVACRIVVPVDCNPDKVASMRALGAEIIEYGRDFDEAREYVEAIAPKEGWRYVHSANEPQLIAGIGTCALEIFEQQGDLDFVFVPIGGGSGASACVIVRDGRAARARIIGVQAARADAFARSWRGQTRVTAAQADTFAEGIATRSTFDLTFSILEDGLDDIVVVDEEALLEGVRTVTRLTGQQAEGAGAAAIAGAREYEPAQGATVACVMSGGNLDPRVRARL